MMQNRASILVGKGPDLFKDTVNENIHFWRTYNDHAIVRVDFIARENIDSTNSLINLLESLPENRTTKVYVVLYNTIILSETITLPDYTVIEIHGKVRMANNANVDMFRIGNVTTPGRYIEIRGGEIDCNRANQSAGLGINIRPGEDILIENVYIHDAREQNIRVFGDSKRITIKNVRGVDGQAGNIYFLHASVGGTQPEITDSSIENCQLYYTVSSVSTTNIELMNCRRITVVGDHLYGTTDFGIHAEEHCYDSVIASNTIYGHNQDGIRIGYSSGNFDAATFRDTSVATGDTFTATADAISDFEYTVPASPSANDEISLDFRRQNSTNKFRLILKRNAGNTNWDIQLRLVTAGTPSTPSGWADVTNVGTTNALKVIASGSSISVYSRTTLTWTKRGNTITNTNLQTQTDLEAEAVSGTTLTSVVSYPISSSNYSFLTEV